jgi:hypothetical protein
MELPAISHSILKICRSLTEQNLFDSYYLAGGTALAVQIKHRRSVDLDFFTSGKVNSDSIIAWMEDTCPDRNAEVIFRKLDQLDLRMEGVKVSFIEYPFPLIYPLTDGSVFEPGLSNLKLAPAREISLFKAYSLGRRTSFRDYLDLYYLLQDGHTSIEQIILDCRRKYLLQGESFFSGKLFLQQLAYTEDISDKDEAMSMLFDITLTAEAVENVLARHITKYLSTIDHNKEKPGDL